MAMVKSEMFIPKEDNLACLEQIHGHARVLRRFPEQGVLNQILIVSDDGYAACIDSVYGDVEFKFECFSLNVSSCALISWGETREICKLGDWDLVKCLFRFEYRGLVANEGVSSSRKQVIQKRGKQGDVFEEATAIGCAFVGIVFWNSVNQCPDLLVANDDIADDPTSLQVSKEMRTIESFMNTCEVVNLEDVLGWTKKVHAWLNSR